MIDPPERVEPNHIIVVEGLHPLYDERVRRIDFSVYLDISDEVKIAWKIQRDMENGATATKMSWLRSTLDALILTPTFAAEGICQRYPGIAYAVD